MGRNQPQLHLRLMTQFMRRGIKLDSESDALVGLLVKKWNSTPKSALQVVTAWDGSARTDRIGFAQTALVSIQPTGIRDEGNENRAISGRLRLMPSRRRLLLIQHRIESCGSSELSGVQMGKGFMPVSQIAPRCYRTRWQSLKSCFKVS